MKYFDAILNFGLLAAIALLVAWGAWNLPLLFTIPAVPEVQEVWWKEFWVDDVQLTPALFMMDEDEDWDNWTYLYAAAPSLTLRPSFSETNDFDNVQFRWSWYGLQTVSIIYESYDLDETKECAVYVEWTNGLETCLNAPSIGGQK